MGDETRNAISELNYDESWVWYRKMRNMKLIIGLLSLAIVGLLYWFYSPVLNSPKLSKIKTIQQASNRPIEFYGVVLDQYGKPVPYARVVYSVLDYEGTISFAGTSRTYWKDTDPHGRFSVSGIKGEHITISKIEKNGYEFEFLNRTYHTFPQWEGHKPLSMGNKDKAVVFHAWKKNETEALVYNEVLIAFSPQGETYAIDLLKPKKVLNGYDGDIRVSFNRPVSVTGTQNKVDWSVSLEGINGGIIESADAFMNEAPESGYQRDWIFEMKRSNPNYRFQVSKKFYLKSRDGKVFGRLEFDFIPIYNEQSVINAKWWLNPNGSRNLQYEPSKRMPLK